MTEIVETPDPDARAGEAALPLSALLSQALVAFTIEVDNAFEQRMVHRTTTAGGRPGGPRGPWLTSAAMYWTCLRFLDDDGLTVAELQRRARTRTNLDGMRRWRYVDVDPPPPPGRAKAPGPSAVLRPTRAGRRARAVWEPLFGEVQQRWVERFGEPTVAEITTALERIVESAGMALPGCLPILGYGMFTAREPGGAELFAPGTAPQPGEERSLLFTLLSRALILWAIAYEPHSRLSLAISANAVRVLGEEAVRVRDLPALTGVSKEALAMATGFLSRQGYAVDEPGPGRGRVVRLTAEGLAARALYGELAVVVEDRWRERFGADVVDGLRAALTRLAGDGTLAGSRLAVGLTAPRTAADRTAPRTAADRTAGDRGEKRDVCSRNMPRSGARYPGSHDAAVRGRGRVLAGV